MKRVLFALALILSLALSANPAAACDPGDPGFPPGISC